MNPSRGRKKVSPVGGDGDRYGDGMPGSCVWRPGGRRSWSRGEREEGISPLALGRAAALPRPMVGSPLNCRRS
jgi:hypothetical protein